MKVAIIGQTLNKNFASKISGGIQSVERLHVKILMELGHEVYFIASKDSEQFNDKITLCLTDTLSLESSGDNLSRAQKAANSKKSAVEIREWINEIKPDFIINHSFSSSHIRLLADLSKTISSICFVHNLPDTAMDIGIIAKVQHYLTLTRNGGALVCVSRYQRDLWRIALSQRVKNSESFNFLAEEDIDKIYDKYCYPVYVNDPGKTTDAADHFIVITRPDPIKNLHKLLELSKHSFCYPLHIYLAHPGKLEDNEYYVTKIAPAIESLRKDRFDVKLFHNAPRNDLLEDLASARGCFIPCTVEAAPVVLLESGSFGVRSIVFAKAKKNRPLDHAANDLVGADNFELVDVSETESEAAASLSNAIQKLQKDPGNRQKLSEHVLSRHGFSNRTCDIMDLLTSIGRPVVKRKQLWE